MVLRKLNNGKQAHHMWTAEAGEDGVPRVKRTRQEPDRFQGIEDKEASRRNASLAHKVAGEICVAHLGLFGANMVDDTTFAAEIPRGVAHRFQVSARTEEAPRVYEWEELRRAFSPELVDHARAAISRGIKTRLASKYFDVPFIVAADLMEQVQDVPKEAVKVAVDYWKTANEHLAPRTASQANINERVASILDQYQDPRSHKIAVDSKSESYYSSYYGPFGVELVREVQKRVRADLASAWLRKNGVDQAAADYWSKYFGEYGSRWVSVVPKKLSPKK